MKLKIFLLTLMVVIFTGCGNLQPAGDRIVFDINLEPDEILTEGMSVLRVAFATDEILSKYDTYIEVADNDTSEELALLIYAEDLRLAFLPSIIRQF